MKKRAILFLTLAFWGLSAFAQSVPFGDFTKWVKQANIPGYSLIKCETDGSEYVASFVSGSAALLQIRVSDIKRFKSCISGILNPVIYQWNGYNTVYTSNGERTLFVVAVTESKICFTFGVKNSVPQSSMENMVARTNFRSLSAYGVVSDVAWPNDIPEGLRISCLKAIYALGPEGDFKEVYEVKAFMNSDLVESVESILRRYKGSTMSNISTDSIRLTCTGAEDLPQLKAFYQEGALVPFKYYIKK